MNREPSEFDQSVIREKVQVIANVCRQLNSLNVQPQRLTLRRLRVQQREITRHENRGEPGA